MLKEKLDSRKCFPTAWGKLITEEEAYRQLNRQIAAMTAIFIILAMSQMAVVRFSQLGSKIRMTWKRLAVMAAI